MKSLKDKVSRKLLEEIAKASIVIGISLAGLNWVVNNGVLDSKKADIPVNTPIKEVSKSPVVKTKHEGNRGKADKEFLLTFGTYDLIHRLSNNLILAVDGRIDGRIEPSPATLDAIIEILDDKEYMLRDDIRSILGDWQEGNFRDVVKVHNWAWGNLYGTVGEAGQPNEKAIKKYLQKYDYSK
jgi:hypothetical protein